MDLPALRHGGGHRRPGVRARLARRARPQGDRRRSRLLVARLLHRLRRTPPDHHPRRGGEQRRDHLHELLLRRAALRRAPGRGLPAGRRGPGLRPAAAAGTAPHRLQHRPVRAQHGCRHPGPGTVRDHSVPLPPVGSGRRSTAARGAGRRRLLPGQQRPGQRCHRPPRAALHHEGRTPRPGLPGPRPPRAARPCAVRGRRDGPVRGLHPADRAALHRRLPQCLGFGTARAPGPARRAHRAAQPQIADHADRGGAARVAAQPHRGQPVRPQGRALPPRPGPLQGGQRHPGARHRRPAAPARRAPPHASANRCAWTG